MNTTQDSARPLRIAEFSTSIAGAYAGWLLAQLGAAVARAPLPPASPANSLTRALAYFNAGKPAPEPGALDQADIVITDDVKLLEAHAGAGLEALATRLPQAVIGITSVFGLTGPRAGAPAVPLDAQAAASVSYVLGEPGRAPLSLPPGVLDCQAGVQLAAACLMARGIGLPAGRARIVDVALADVLVSYVAANARLYIHHGLEWARAGRRASGSGGAYPFVILPCKDGDICLSGRTRQEWERFVAAMGSPAWAQEPRYQKLRIAGRQYPEEMDALVLPWLQQHTKAEIEDIANRQQLTISPLRSMAEVLATPQLAQRGFLHDWDCDGRTLRMPGLPFRAATSRAADAPASLAPHMLAACGPALRGLPAATGKKLLEGLRVLDLGWVWSAPQVAGVLAQYGAEVIKIEHGARLDNTRLSGLIFRNGEKIEGDTTQMSPMFHQINQCKRGVTLNVKQPEAVALIKRLAARADIVLENMSAGALDRSGLGYNVLRALNPRLIMVALSGAGQFGPLSDMRTYAPSMSSFAGVESLVGYAGERPIGALNFALGDPNSAAHALLAIFAALARRAASGDGCYIDLSQIESLIVTLAPYVLQSQLEGAQPPPLGNAHPGIAPHGIFPAAGTDRWLSLATATEAQWAALAALAPEQAWARDAAHETMAGRLANRVALEAAIADWTAGFPRDTLLARLHAAGIPAAPVNSIAEMWDDPHFAARGMHRPVELPVLGPVDMFRAPWLFSDGTPDIGRGPLLGEHNREVLQGILGLDDAEFAQLVDQGVIA